MDLIHDHKIWGDEKAFLGTICMEEPCHPLKYGQSDNKVDEVVDGFWYKETVRECASIANGERFIVLGLICYCDKTGTDVYQQNSLEPFSFTFCIFNQQCRYRTAAWHTLGQLPDFDNMSSASHCVLWGGYKGKGRSIRNFHACLEVILAPFISNQGNTEAIYANIHFGDKVAVCHCFFMTYVMGDGLSSDKMCGRFLGYSQVHQLSRVCDVSFENSDNPQHNCEHISMYYLQ